MRGNYRRTVLMLLCVPLLILMTGCLQDFVPQFFRDRTIVEMEEVVPPPDDGKNEDEKELDVLPEGILHFQVYYLEGSGEYLLPVTIAMPWTEGVGRAALNKLIEGPTPAKEMRYGLTSLLPPTTEVRGLTIRDGLARVDLNESFLEYDPGMERDVLDSVVFTLLQFPTVEEVEIMVEGAVPGVFPGGTPGESLFSRQRGVNLEVAEEIDDYRDTQQVILYYCHVMGDNKVFYVPITRVVSGDRNPAKATMEELLNGPRQGSKLFSEIPAETKLREVSLEGELLVVNFSREILNYRGGLSGEEHLLRQIVFTASTIPGVKKVQLLVEGEAITLPYGTSFQEPVSTSSRILNLLD